MKKIIIIVLIFLFLVIGFITYKLTNKNINNNSNSINNNEEYMENIKVNINGTIYEVTILDNETTKAFINKLPQEFNMQELNDNEKYVYLDYELPANSINPKQITKGDIMLYGNDCLVIFYKSFETNYSYTKIGHIDNLVDLGSGTINVKFEK